MKQRILIALLTVFVLGAGYGAGVWTERHSCKVPAPPPRLLSELSSSKQAAATPAATPAPNAAQLAAEIARLRPQIDEFRARMEAMDREMDTEINAILRPDQQELFQKLIKRYADLRVKEDEAVSSGPGPLTADEITQLKQKPLYKMLAIVVVPMRVEWNTHDLNLDQTQQEQLTKILRSRRDKFLALVDSSPPPSLQLSRLAPVAQRLGEPAK